MNAQGQSTAKHRVQSGLLTAFTLLLCGTVLTTPKASAHRFLHTTSRTNLITPTLRAGTPDPGGKYFGQIPDPSRVRRYFIAAEWSTWDFAPGNRDPICGSPSVIRNPGERLQSRKIRYIQYQDASFQSRSYRPERLGILGPALRGVVGDFLVVTFLNRTDRPLSMHPHGVSYDKDSEGAYYNPNPGIGAAVGPKAQFTYVWKLDAASGPGPKGPSSKAWMYHSHVHDEEEINLGLMGPIIVTDPARARPDATPEDLDREMVAWFQVYDETLVELENRALPPGFTPTNSPGSFFSLPRPFQEMVEMEALGERHTINGLAFGNLSGLDINQGDKVRWYLFAIGGQKDFHSVHWHGNRLTLKDESVDVVELLPASMKTVDMQADNPGTWLLQCHVAEHMMGGMFAYYNVHPDSQPVDRSRDRAFLGLEKETDTLRLSAAQWQTVPASTTGPRRILNVTGRLQIDRGTSLQNRPVRVQLGAKAVALTLDASGSGSADGFRWKSLNLNPQGQVTGNQLEFTWSFEGADWDRVIPPPTSTTAPTPTLPESQTTVVPLQLHWESTPLRTMLRVSP